MSLNNEIVEMCSAPKSLCSKFLYLRKVWVTYCSVVEADSTQESILSTGGASLDAIRLELDKGTIVRELVVSQKSIYP